MMEIAENPPVLVCCGRMLRFLWDEELWAAFCTQCGRAFAVCDPIPAAFADEVMVP